MDESTNDIRKYINELTYDVRKYINELTFDVRKYVNELTYVLIPSIIDYIPSKSILLEQFLRKLNNILKTRFWN